MGAARPDDLMAVCGGLLGLRNLSLRCCDAHDLQPLEALTRLTHLALSSSSSEACLRRLASLPSLISLDLCGRLEDLSPLTTLSGLQHLKSAIVRSFSTTSPLFCYAMHYVISSCRIAVTCPASPLLQHAAHWSIWNWGNVGASVKLSWTSRPCRGSLNCGIWGFIIIKGSAAWSSCRLFRHWIHSLYTRYSCRGIQDLSPLSPLISLWRLEINACPAVESLDALSSLTSLTCLMLAGGGGEEWSLAPPLASLSGLLRLHLYRVDADLIPLSHLTKLRHLGLSSPLPLLHHNLDLQPLSSCISLEHLRLGFWHSSADLSPITKCRELKRVHLPGVEDGCKLMKPLEGMPDLRVALDPGCNLQVMLHMWDARRGEWAKYFRNLLGLNCKCFDWSTSSQN